MKKDKLKEAWRNYVLDEVNPGRQIRRVIFESWQRCREISVDPWQKKPARILTQWEFRQLLMENASLIEFCASYMQTLYAFVRGSGFVIALTNAEGIILQIIGDPDVKNQIQDGGFQEGADWSEASAGTNAIGTSLRIGKPIQVYSYEHYCRCAQVSTCSCAVIRNEHQAIVASISLVGYDYNVHSHTLGMAVAVADAINNALVMLQAQQACDISDTYKSIIMDSMSQGVLAVNKENQITHLNKNALELLGLDKQANYIGQPLGTAVPEKNKSFYTMLENKKRYTDREMTLTTSDGDHLFNITSRIIQTEADDHDGMVIILDAIQRVRKIARRMSGAVAQITFDDLIGGNAQYLERVQIAKNAATSDFNVLLLGESGTGKDVFAQAIHNHSSRAKGPFVAINCSAIPRELIGSELFGYVEGAYTGARKGGSPGKFELADGGTIFLDEIGDMPMDLQGHLLRVIEEKQIMRIGGHDMIPVDVRIIAATNQNLIEEIGNNRFRQDLYYRLNVITIQMIPFRDRMDDLPALVEFFYSRIAGNLGKPAFPIPEETIARLQRYTYPGNIRELQNIIERCLILSIDGRLDAAYLPPEVLQSEQPTGRGHFAVNRQGIPESESEKEKIYQLIMKNKGNISKTAKELGVARSTLYRKLDRYGYAHNISMK